MSRASSVHLCEPRLRLGRLPLFSATHSLASDPQREDEHDGDEDVCEDCKGEMKLHDDIKIKSSYTTKSNA